MGSTLWCGNRDANPDDAPGEVLKRLRSHGGGILSHKRYFDVFTNPNVGPVDALPIDDVVVYGVALDVCNRYAVEGLLERCPGLPITLVTDAARVINEDARDELLTDWRRRGVKLIRTAEVVDEAGWRVVRGRPRPHWASQYSNFIASFPEPRQGSVATEQIRKREDRESRGIVPQCAFGIVVPERPATRLHLDPRLRA